MADEIRVSAAKRGVDLSSFTLLPFGGAGGVHAAAVADELRMKRILVPARPGAFSALGLLCTDVVHDYIRSELKAMRDLTPDHVETVFTALAVKARAELATEKLDPGQASFARELDLRYAGQGYEIRTSLEGLYRRHVTEESLSLVRARFDEQHALAHGHAARERGVEVVSYRLRVRVVVPKYQPFEETARALGTPAIKATRRVHFDTCAVEAAVYERDALDVGTALNGPAVVEQFDATTAIPPGWSGRVDPMRNLIVEKRS